MALSDEQRTLLQLILEQGQSYDDIASLLGVDAGEVRARARAALKEIGGEDPDAEVGLTDYLLGQADPIGRADAARHLQSDPEANELAGKLEAQLTLLAPKADLPKLPAAPAAKPGRTAPAEAGKAKDSGAGSSGTSLSTGQKRLIAALLGGGVLVALIVLLATGTLGGSDSSDSTTSTTASTPTTSTPSTDTTASTPGSSKTTSADLRPTNGGKGRGVALSGRVKNKAVIVIRAIRLDPTPKGESYLIWLRSEKAGKASVRIGAAPVGKNGIPTAPLPVPNQVIELVAAGAFTSVEVSLASNAAYKQEVARAKAAKRLPAFTGTSVLAGTIKGPLVSAGARAAASQGSAPQQGQGSP